MLNQQAVKVLTLTGLEMVIVTMRQTMQTAILMVVIVVDQMSTLNGVHNVFVMNKYRMITHLPVIISYYVL